MAGRNIRRAMQPPANVDSLTPVEIQAAPSSFLPTLPDPNAPFKGSPLTVGPSPFGATDPDRLQNFTRRGLSQQRIFSLQPQASAPQGSSMQSNISLLAGGKLAQANSVTLSQPATAGPSDQAVVTGQINPATTGVRSQIQTTGSVFSSISGALSYASTTSSITWSWTGLVVYRADGTTTSIPDGSKSFTGLTSSTTYYFYPAYIEETGEIEWAGGAQTAVSITSAATQIGQGVIPMSLAVVSAATTSGGSGGGSGGGAGGGGGRNTY